MIALGFVFNGMRVSIDDTLGREFVSKQCRFHRSKRKRIRKKWQKDRRNYCVIAVDSLAAFFIGRDCIVMNTLAFKAMNEQIALDNATTPNA
jgi:archaeosine-15-forming tRNA-guanine transglycosylase